MIGGLFDSKLGRAFAHPPARVEVDDRFVEVDLATLVVAPINAGENFAARFQDSVGTAPSGEAVPVLGLDRHKLLPPTLQADALVGGDDQRAGRSWIARRKITK